MVSTKNYQEAARIQFLKRIEVAYDIKPLDVALETTGSLEMGDAIFNLFKRLFRTAKKKPTTFQELRQLYVAIIKHSTCSDIIISKQCSNGERRKQYNNCSNKELIQLHVA